MLYTIINTISNLHIQGVKINPMGEKIKKRFTKIIPDPSYVDLSVIDYGYEECNSLHSYGPTIREYYLFHYIMSGKGKVYYFDDEGTCKTLLVKGGEGFMIWPGQIARYIADEHDPWTYTWVGFAGLKAQGVVAQSGLTTTHPVYTARSLEEDTLLKEKFLSIVDSINRPPIELIGNFYLLFSMLIEASAARKKPPGDSLRAFYVNEAINYMEQHYQEKITIDDIAAYCSLNRSYLGKIFNNELKTSPQDFLIRYRVSKACELMKTTDINIGDICGMVGYPNLFTFSRAFKKVIGESPREWRIKNKLR